MTRSYLLSGIFLISSSFGLPDASAEEVATIVNRTNIPIQFQLRWSHMIYPSAIITLQPGQHLTPRGPDGARLFIEYDSSINDPVYRPSRHNIYTLRVYSPYQFGKISDFVHRNAWSIGMNYR